MRMKRAETKTQPAHGKSKYSSPCSCTDSNFRYSLWQMTSYSRPPAESRQPSCFQHLCKLKIVYMYCFSSDDSSQSNNFMAGCGFLNIQVHKSFTTKACISHHDYGRMQHTSSKVHDTNLETSVPKRKIANISTNAWGTERELKWVTTCCAGMMWSGPCSAILCLRVISCNLQIIVAAGCASTASLHPTINYSKQLWNSDVLL